MATVVKCDECGKVDKPSAMKYMVIQIGHESQRGIDYNSSNMVDGDFCSQECITKFIDQHIINLWYGKR